MSRTGRVDTPCVKGGTPPLSRQFYKSLYYNFPDAADGHFDRFAGKDPNHVSPEMVSDDLQTLKSVAEKIEGFADKRIAHHDRKPPSNLPTFGEADECLKKMDELAVKYIQLFRGYAQSSLMPTIEYDWTEFFGVPWLPSDNGAVDC